MKVALFHTTLPEPERKLGGVEIAVHQLANELAKNTQDEVSVFSLSLAPSTATYRHRQLFANAQWLRQSRLARLLLLPFCLNVLRFRDFDVLHLHGDDWFFLRRTIPTVRTFHGSALREAHTATSLKRRISQYVIFPLEYISSRLASISLAVGEETARIYRIECIIDNGVDLRTFRPGDKATLPHVLYVGTWDGRKRGRFMFEVFTKYVLPKVPNATLHMVSDFCPEHPNVVSAGHPDDETLAELYREAWVFALPSTYEGFGIPYLEALASGTAVLSSSNSGAIHVLDKGKYGLIVDDESFGAYLIDLLNDPIKRRKLEIKGRKRAGKFSWTAVAAEHREIYAKIISEGSRS
jgi:phosphatidylinositol alpha-mannosyltransferase